MKSGKMANYYNEYYYGHCCGVPYERDDHWLNFFGNIAERIITDINPKTILDAGCAMGILVEQLRQKGVETWGLDISEYAIEKVHPSVKSYCWVGSVTEPFPNKYDLIVSIEVLEHLPKQEAELAIKNFCQYTDDILFSSSPYDYKEATHLNVQPPEYWAEHFARHGFIRDIDFDASFLTPWAVRFRRNNEPLHRVIRAIERKFWLLSKENRDLRDSVIESHQQIGSLNHSAEESTAKAVNLESELEQYLSKLQQTQTQLENFQSQLQQTQTKLEESQAQQKKSQSQLEQKQAEIVQLQTQIQEFSTQLRLSQTTICAMESSKFWQLRSLWFRFRHAIGVTDNHIPFYKILFSNNKKKWDTLIAAKSPQKIHPEIPTSDDINYQKWLKINYPTSASLKKMADAVEMLAYKPVISIIMPVFNTPENFLREAIESVLKQVYPYWELCIADDASPVARVRQVLNEYSAKDSRIKVVFRTENGHISHSSNSALEIATGEFIALLDHDDLLTPDALYEIALLLNKHPEADMVYSDEDKIDDSGKLRDPFFKPDWCPDSLLSRNYICHLGTYRRKIVNEIGGFRPGYEGSQDYDLILRFTEKTNNIFHIPKILYHWRIHSESCSSEINAKPYAAIAAEKALTDALHRRGKVGRITEAASLIGHYIVRYKISDYKLVSIIIPTRDLGEVLDQCLKSIFEKTVYPNYEVVLIDNGSEEQKTLDIISKWEQQEPKRFRSYRYDIPFNYSKINNYAVKQAKGDYLLFLNNDIEVITPDWIDAMVEQAQRSSIGAVGTLLLYPDNTIQHAGVVLGVGGVAGHSHKNFPANSPGYFDQILTVNNYSALTAACLMCRYEVFQSVGGFEEELTVAFNDIDLCLKFVAQGYRNIYLPHAKLYHHESKSRGYENTPEKQARFRKEIEYMQEKWKYIIDNDPCYNSNLTRNHEDYGIRV